MARLRHLLSGCALAACVSPALAQSPYAQPVASPGYVNPFAPQSDADLLAQQMRQVAANPTDLYALLNAAKLSLRVGDIDAAAALYTRAERVNPVHPQVKAGMARLLVQSGRPGAALRKFQDAERAGATMVDFGPDRALAYDLIGEQQRAQREYRALLRLGADDETTRRYALSLGISGLKEPALALLEPLNRRSDRGAWRARAFVLAMTGDRSGADKIATTMMPPGTAKGLEPFFDRLPRLSATERAFAVSFGETRATPTRVADARMTPSLPALAPEPNPFPQSRAPVQVAAVEDVDDGKKKRRRPKKDRARPVQAARQPYVAPLPAPPAPTAIQLAALTAGRATSTPFMPARTGGKVTVLPPPPEAYRGSVAQVAAKPANPADGDEPDFAVAAVSALAAEKQPAATARITSAPVTFPRASATPPVLAAAAPTAVTTTAVTTALPTPAAPTARDGTALFGDRPATGTIFSLAGTTTMPAPAPASTPTGGAATTVVPVTTATVPPVAVAASAGASPTPGALSEALPPASAASAPTPGFTGLAVAPPTDYSGTAGPTIASAVTVAPSIDPPAIGVASPTPAATTVAATAAITPATGAPPAPEGVRGDDALAAIVAGIKIPDAELSGPIAGVPPPPATPTGTRLLANIDAKAAAATPAGSTLRSSPAKLDPTLPKKDARGRFVDGKGKPLLDAQGRPMGPRGAAAWQLAQTKGAAEDAGDERAPTLPKKDARGRFVDDKGKPLLDPQGRPMGPRGAAAWQLAQNKKGATEEAGDERAPTLPKKDARGRYLDNKGKPLLDARGRPMGPKAAAAWQLAQYGGADDTPAKAKPDPSLPKKDARGRFVDDKGKPLLDARGRAMTETAARAWKVAQAKEAADAKTEAAAARGEPQRFWVQVAGGANQATLGREWARVSAATPSLKGKSGWTTPLRATNRILTGPFKTSGEAMAMVNQLKKEGLPAFMFTSDAGQKVARLGGK